MNIAAADLSQAPAPSAILIYGGTAMCLDAKRSVWRHCEILVQRGVVASVGRSLTLTPGTQLLDVTGLLVIPGLVDAEARLSTAPLGDERALGAYHDAETAAAVARVGALEALAAGVTTIADGAFPGVDETALQAIESAASSVGLRRYPAPAADDVSPPQDGSEVSPPQDGSEESLDAEARGGRGVGESLGLAGLTSVADLLDATVGAADRLGRAAEVGSLVVGKWADLIAVEVPGVDLEGLDDDGLHRAVASGRGRIRHALIAGTPAVTDGRPVHAEVDPARQAFDLAVETLRRRRDAAS
ncbi:MAG: hypothetical protein AAGM22_03165 [Acidobacteriota bacterium]